MDTFLRFLGPGLELLGPILVAILTVPLMGLLKRAVVVIGKLPAWIQQIVVLFIAVGLTWVGTVLQVVLPTDLALFTDTDLSALLSAAMAFGIHAGMKAKER